MTDRTPSAAAARRPAHEPRGLVRRAALLSAVLLAAAVPTAAQESPNLQLVPKVGVFTPLGSLTENSEMEIALALGVAAELTLPRLPFNVRANVEHATTTNIVQRGVTETVLGDVAITTIVGDVVLRPLPPTATFQPYFMGGGGVKVYSFSTDAPLAGELTGIATTARRGTLHIGGGVDARFGPLALLLEISNYISTFADAADESRLQNHVYGMLGFRVSMF